jgi:hypothetical protein
MKRLGILTAAIILISLSLIGIGVVYAATTTYKIGNVYNVISTDNPDVGIYADEACTTPIILNDFGNMSRGETSIEYSVYLKNNGTVSINAIMAAEAFGSNPLEVYFTPSTDTSATIAPGEVVRFAYSFTVYDDATVGSSRFDTVFNCSTV